MNAAQPYQPKADAPSPGGGPPPDRRALITAADLQRKVLPAPKEILPGIIPVGLSILASKPKIGKSWLMLLICLAIAMGGRALGRDVVRGQALYFGLEDSERRLQERLKLMTQGHSVWPEGLLIGTHGELPAAYHGGLEALDNHIAEAPDARIAVIDTLGRFRGEGPGNNSNAYQEDTKLGDYLQEIALRHNIALVAVHHKRKAAGADSLDSVSGSTGLTGVADTVLLLDRVRGEADAVLEVTSRDIEEAEYALNFHKLTCTWELLGDAKEYARSQQQRQILEVLKDQPEGDTLTPQEIAKEAGMSVDSVRHLLKKMLNDAVVHRPEYGRYAYWSPA